MAAETAANATFNMTVAVKQLLEVGFFNFILPFGIFFIILYGLLDRFSVISKEKRVNALAAALISAFMFLYAYLNNIEWFFALFYAKTALAIIILMFALTFAVFFYRTLEENKVIPAGAEKAYAAAAVIGATLLMQMIVAGAPGELGNLAQQVSGIVLSLGTLAALASFFVTGKGGGGEE